MLKLTFLWIGVVEVVAVVCWVVKRLTDGTYFKWNDDLTSQMPTFPSPPLSASASAPCGYCYSRSLSLHVKGRSCYIRTPLQNITKGNPLCQNDNECHHQIVILVTVINYAAPWSLEIKFLKFTFCTETGLVLCISTSFWVLRAPKS